MTWTAKNPKVTFYRDLPDCRHHGGEEDCPPMCLLLYGERFFKEET